MRKIIARFLGQNFPYFKGKDKIIRFLFSPDKNLNSGEKFITTYFEKKYEGITSNFIDWGVYIKGGLEKGLVNYIKSQISNFEIFFDIGANSGTISLPFCHMKNLKIICFEPLDINYKKLINNFKINNAYDNNVFHKLALSNKNSETKIYFSDFHSNTGTATMENNLDVNHNQFELINQTKLDDIYKYKNKNIFIKIDIQGHEDKFVDGALELLNNNNILMYLETHNEILLNKFKKMNYKIFYPVFLEKKFHFQSFRNSEDVILKNF